MKLRHAITALALALSLSASAILPADTSAATTCGTWAGQLKGSPDLDYYMHIRGCRKPYTTWIQDMDRCPSLARKYALAGSSIEQLTLFTRVQGCVLFEDGSWGDR